MSTRDRLQADHDRIAGPQLERPLPMSAELWLAERWRTALDISQLKQGEEREGWIEDAIYYAIILRRLMEHPTNA
jgi:hypothetical protein